MPDIDQHSVTELLRGRGYYLLPKSHPSSPGYTGLAIAIRERPSNDQFDPIGIRVRLKEICEETDGWSVLKISTSLEGVAHICHGLVTILDRTDNRKSFFTFGGSVESGRIDHGTVYAISSPVPILEMDVSEGSVPVQLAVETEAMIAKVKAKWEPDEEAFARRLDEVDPFEFYTAALEELLLRYRRGDCPATDSCRSLCDALHQERAWLKDSGKWPEKVARFEDLLAKP